MANSYCRVPGPPQARPQASDVALLPVLVRAHGRSIVLGTIALAALVAVVLHVQERTGNLSAVHSGSDDSLVLAELHDCNAGWANWFRGWSDGKKEWCCSHAGRGCPEETPGLDPFDCMVGLARWETGWSADKQTWCCTHKGMGCPEATHISLTFVAGNLNFKSLEDQPDHVLTCFEGKIKKETADTAGHGVQTKDIFLEYWGGSGIHSTSDKYLGIVVRQRVAVPSIKDVGAVGESFKSAMFPDFLAQVIRQCDQVGAFSKPPVMVFDITVQLPLYEACTCENGAAATGSRCPKAGGEVCKDCMKGFHLTSTLHCTRNSCRCDGGVPAEGDLCGKHATVQCASCFPGYHLNNLDGTGHCLRNRCTCGDGIPAVGRECNQHKAEICGACAAGFHVNATTKACEATRCKCPWGTPASPADCPEHGAHWCARCTEGFHLTKGYAPKCKMNECICNKKLGEAALGPLCAEHGTEGCASCVTGVHLHRDGTCGPRACECPNGIPAVDKQCTTHKGIICSECNPGFKLQENQCIGDDCKCEHGTPEPNGKCLQEGDSICESCLPGYNLVGKKCVPNKCLCENGRAATGSECPMDGMYSCTRCKDGYRHRLTTITDEAGTQMMAVECVPNLCQCVVDDMVVGAAATHLTTPLCLINGENVCVSCSKGYHRTDANQCERNVCNCTGGTPSTDCDRHGWQNCTECADGGKSSYLSFELPEPRLAAETFIQRFNFSSPEERSAYRNALDSNKGQLPFGIQVCIEHIHTTAHPFDCMAALHNWEKAWSEVKKHYCCATHRIGCVPRASGKELCQDHQYTEEQCRLVGCCEYRVGQCTAIWPDRVCHPEFNIKSWNSRCMQVKRKQNTTLTMSVVVEKCNQKEIYQKLRPNNRHQIHDVLSDCLYVGEPSKRYVGMRVNATACRSDEPDSQRVEYNGTRLQTTDGWCLTALPQENDDEVPVTLARCDPADFYQPWKVSVCTPDE